MKKRRQNLGGAGIMSGRGRLDQAVRVAGYGSIGLLGVLVLALLLPSIGETSHASSCLDDPTLEGCYTTMAETEVGVTASTAISLAMSSQVNMEVIPKSNGATSSASTKLSISTNSPDGYALYMQTGSATGDLVSASSLSESKITNTTKSNVTLSNLEPNAYGYALTEGALDSSTTYSSLPTTGSVIKKTTSVTASEGNYAYGDTYNLAFGVNIGTNLPAGTYTGSVMLSAVANPKTIATMFDLTYMQDMTSDICTNTREGYTKQLIDIRDGKSYWAAKLKDGNCWMTQNLALDITEDGLRASDTDIEEDWNQESTYPPKATNALPLGGKPVQGVATPFSTYSWDFGSSVIATPLMGKSCDANVISGETFGEVCSSAGYVDIDETWKPAFTTQEGKWSFENGTEYSGLVAVDKNAKTYDAHYLVGNYYQYNAATAGTGGALTSGDAPGSICPKGWKMATSAVGDYRPEGSYYNLLKAYGLATETDVNSYTGDNIVDIVKVPLYFSPNSNAYIWSGAITKPGGSGSYMSSTAYSENDALKSPILNFAFTGDFIWINRHDDVRQSGGNVRCLAR